MPPVVASQWPAVLDSGQARVHAQLMTKRTNDPTIAIGYLRVSTEDQNLGPEAQRASIEAWAAREGISVVEWLMDKGVSGAAPIEERPALMAALVALKAHNAGVFAVAKLDRIARDVGVGAMIERAVGQAGASLRSSDGIGNVDSPEGVMLRGMVGVFAQYERALIRARTKAALAAKKAKGERAGECPFGYKVGEDGKTLVRNEEEQSIIETVRALRAEGVSLRAIVKKLGELQARSRAGTPFGCTQVVRMAA